MQVGASVQKRWSWCRRHSLAPRTWTTWRSALLARGHGGHVPHCVGFWPSAQSHLAKVGPGSRWGQSLRLKLAWAERSHRVTTPDRRRRMRCRVDSWAMRGSRNTCVSKWPRPAWPRGVCTRRGRGTFFRVPSCRGGVAWGKPWRIIAGAHRPPPPGQKWKSKEAVQKEMKVGTAVCLGHAAVGGGGGDVMRFAEKRTEQDDGDERGVLSGSSGGKFLCPDCGDDFPTLWRLKCHRGKAHGVQRVPTLPRQLPLQSTRHGAFGKGCERLQGGLDGRPAGGAHEGGAQRGGS